MNWLSACMVIVMLLKVRAEKEKSLLFQCYDILKVKGSWFLQYHGVQVAESESSVSTFKKSKLNV